MQDQSRQLWVFPATIKNLVFSQQLAPQISIIRPHHLSAGHHLHRTCSPQGILDLLIIICHLRSLVRQTGASILWEILVVYH
jgi:hypothetical protein